MKRDHLLVTAILRLLEKSDQPFMTWQQIRTSIAGDDEIKQDLVTHHLWLLIDRGLIDTYNGDRVRLTWDGHEVISPPTNLFD
ncbi:hypothetical protein [Burkholderia gladioli]|uniref:hypothetical protein n=1 Tax=Burkholderia gladioli TaxID=28095 RepID=UPI0034DB76E5